MYRELRPTTGLNPETNLPSQQAIPQLTQFAGQTILIKFGGSVLADSLTTTQLVKQAVELKHSGANVVIVHGGGTGINSALAKLGIETKKIEGLRITDKETLSVVMDVLGTVNHNLVERFQANGVEATSFCLPHNSILLAKKLKLADEKKDIGWVGEIEAVDSEQLHAALQEQSIPVIAPLGKDHQGNFYNINADHAAFAVATALKTNYLIFLTDVAGVLADVKDPNTRIGKIKIRQIPQYINEEIVAGGMLPKLRSCVAAIDQGIQRIAILNGHKEQAIIDALLKPDQIGTLVTGDI